VEGKTDEARDTKRGLEGLGYRVILAASGEAAIEAWRDSDLILMDIELGQGLDGAQTAQRILGEAEIPIIFLASRTEAGLIGKIEGISSYGLVTSPQSLVVLEASIKLAFRLFEADREMKRSNNKLEATLHALPDLVFEVDLDGRYYDIHAPDPSLLYRPAAERLGRYIKDYLPPETTAIVQGALAEAKEKGLSKGVHYELEVPAGKRSFEVFASRMKGHEDNPHLIYLCRDITDRSRLEAELAEAREFVDKSESDFRILTDNLPILISYFNADTIRYEYVNKAFLSLFGLPRERMLGSHLRDIIGEDNVRFAMPYIEEARKGRSVTYVNVFNVSGGKIWGRVTYVPVRDKAGKVASILVFTVDITEQKEAEESIKALLDEKDLILREVNHRIKNNMANMAALLNLQSHTQTEAGAAAALRDASGRIQTMMLLYDKLYRSKSFLAISAKEYLESLVDEVMESFSPGISIEVAKDIEDHVLDTKTLQPLGIILNELLTNIMKYAFDGRPQGKVGVSTRLEGGRFRLEVWDNGKGMPASVDFKHSPGFGLMMVGLLTEQLEGQVEIDRTEGTRILIDFPA
jgi:PAS domain S-box-containing protein